MSLQERQRQFESAVRIINGKAPGFEGDAMIIVDWDNPDFRKDEIARRRHRKSLSAESMAVLLIVGCGVLFVLAALVAFTAKLGNW